jgi:predicted nucleic acid-binding protein
VVITALYDACVLYPFSLRDLLVELAVTRLFDARWTNRIHDEWVRNLLEDHPEISLMQLERTKKLMNQAVLDSLITDFEHFIPSINLPDPNDAHVVAAAVACKAGRIVTFNLKDFPDATLQPLGILAIHPDDFVLEIMSLDALAVVKAVSACQTRFRNPPRSISEQLDRLENVGLVRSVAQLKTYWS